MTSSTSLNHETISFAHAQLRNAARNMAARSDGHHKGEGRVIMKFKVVWRTLKGIIGVREIKMSLEHVGGGNYDVIKWTIWRMRGCELMAAIRFISNKKNYFIWELIKL